MVKKVILNIFMYSIISCAGITATETDPQGKEDNNAYASIEEALEKEQLKEQTEKKIENEVIESNKKVIEAVELNKPEKVIVEVPLQQFSLNNYSSDRTDNKSKNSFEIVKDNINLSVAKITDSNFTNAEIVYNYLEGIIYPIITAPNQITDIVMQEGEIIKTQPAIGDKGNWKVEIQSVVNVSHIYLKPRTHGLETNMIINTDKRVYRIKLISTENNYMPAVKYSYDFEGKGSYTKGSIKEANIEKEEEINERDNYKRIADMVMKDSYNDIFWNYKIIYKPNKKYKPKWYPNKVFDDGIRTYLFIPDIVRTSTRPMIMSTDKKGKNYYMVNYRINGKYYIVDGVYDYLMLAAGTDKKERVFVVRDLK